LSVWNAPHHPSALEPPGEWADLRQGCPVAPIKPAGGDEEPKRRAGLIAGGLRQVPVRWQNRKEPL
jgi:hypothetical protein